MDSLEDRWAVAVRLANRQIADAIAERFLADEELAAEVAACLSDSPLPQLHTLSWLRKILVKLAHEPTRRPAKVRGELPRLVAIVRGPPSTEEHLPKVFPYMLKKNWKD